MHDLATVTAGRWTTSCSTEPHPEIATVETAPAIGLSVFKPSGSGRHALHVGEGAVSLSDVSAGGEASSSTVSGSRTADGSLVLQPMTTPTTMTAPDINALRMPRFYP